MFPFQLLPLSLRVGFIFLVYAQTEIGDIDLGCSTATYRHGDFCYALMSPEATFEEAQKICVIGRGTLAFDNGDEASLLFIRRLRIQKYGMSYWIGLNDRESEGRWVYSDRSVLQRYNKWNPGEPNSAGQRYQQDCVAMGATHNLNWDDKRCEMKYWYVCEFHLDKTNCPDNEAAVQNDNHCYEIVTELATYEQAERSCKSKGGYLVNVKNEGTHNFLKNLILADKLKRKWQDMSESDVLLILRQDQELGKHWIPISYLGGNWVYTDNGSVVTNNARWRPGEPNNILEDCAIDVMGWVNVRCSNTYEYICQFQATTVTTNSNSSALTSSEARKRLSNFAFALLGLVLGIVSTLLVLSTYVYWRRIVSSSLNARGNVAEDQTMIL